MLCYMIHECVGDSFTLNMLCYMIYECVGDSFTLNMLCYMIYKCVGDSFTLNMLCYMIYECASPLFAIQYKHWRSSDKVEIQHSKQKSQLFQNIPSKYWNSTDQIYRTSIRSDRNLHLPMMLSRFPIQI